MYNGFRTENINYEEKLKILECPFNWNFNHVDKSIKILSYSDSDKDYFPLLNLMNCIAILYVWIKEDKPLTDIQRQITACVDCMDDLKKKNELEISIEVANHVLEATKCFAFLKLGMIKEMQRILVNIESVEGSDKKESSTLQACKAIVCLKGHPYGDSQAKKFIREAIKDNPNCHLWHYLLGRILRKIRRSTALFTLPDNEEFECFKNAYDKSKNPVYGIFFAHVNREAQHHETALQMYESIFTSELESNTIILRLALGFIQLGYFDRAKKCLDKAANISTSFSMYFHYQGLYHMKQNQYEEALEFLEKIIEDDNLQAEEQYLQCKINIDNTFKVTDYLLNLYDKYKHRPTSQMQHIVLQIAYSYYRRDHEIDQALKYFLSAIEIDPNAACLSNFYSKNVKFMKNKNIFRYLKRDVLRRFKFLKRKHEFNKDTVDIAEKVEQRCHEHFAQKKNN